MFRNILLLGMILVAHNARALDQSDQSLWCDYAGGKCHIAWDLTAAGKSSVNLDRFDPEGGIWNRVETEKALFGATDWEASAGSIYRLSACDGTTCIPSEAIWVSVKPESVDDIPTYVLDHLGRQMTVSKGTSLVSQTLQYNVYLLAATMGGKNLIDFPPMPPRFYNNIFGTNARSVDDEIHLHVQQQYDAWVQAYMGEAIHVPYRPMEGAGTILTIPETAPDDR